LHLVHIQKGECDFLECVLYVNHKVAQTYKYAIYKNAKQNLNLITPQNSNYLYPNQYMWYDLS